MAISIYQLTICTCCGLYLLCYSFTALHRLHLHLQAPCLQARLPYNRPSALTSQQHCYHTFTPTAMPEFPPNVPSSRCQTVPPLPSHPAVPPEAPSAALPCPPRPALPQPRRRHPSRACDGCGWTQRCSSDSQTTPTNIKKEELKRTPETTLELSRGVCGGTGCGCGARAVLSGALSAGCGRLDSAYRQLSR